MADYVIGTCSGKRVVIDNDAEANYTQSGAGRVMGDCVPQKGRRADRIAARRERRMYLNNRIQRTCSAMLSQERDDDMHRRQQVTINGEKRWLSYDSTQNLVDIVTREVTKRLMDEQAKPHTTFGEYMKQWYDNYKSRELGDGYRTSYQSMMKKHIIPAIGQKNIADITVADVQSIMNTLKSTSTAKQVKCIINMVMDAAIADELYEHPNPTRDKRIVMPTARKKREGLSREELSSLMNLLPELKMEHSQMLAFLLMTGCRRGEMLGARWEDIDWNAKTIHLQRVVRFMNNRPVVSEKMKSKAANRVVSIWDNFIPFLGTKQKNGYIVQVNGEPLSERQFSNRWKAILRELDSKGFKTKFTAHQLRHTYATVAANSGDIPTKVLQQMLGHANFQTTMNVYAGNDMEKVCESSRGLGEKYTEIQGKSCKKVAASKTLESLEA